MLGAVAQEENVQERVETLVPINGLGTSVRHAGRGGRKAIGFHGMNSGPINFEGIMNWGAPQDLGHSEQVPVGSLMREVGIIQGQQRAPRQLHR